MKKLILLSAVLFSCVCLHAQKKPGKSGNTVLLSNGWKISPAGRSVQLGDLPLQLVVSGDKKWMAVTNNGQSENSIQLIDRVSEKVVSTKLQPKAWYGLQFGSDHSSLYASGANDNLIWKYSIIADTLQLTDSFLLGRKWPNKIGVTGIALKEQDDRLFAVTREDSALYVVSLKEHRVVSKHFLGAEAYAAILSPDKKKVYISLWGGDAIAEYDIDMNRIIRKISVGDNPNEMVIRKDGKVLFVSNGNDNTVSVVDLEAGRTVETLTTSLFPRSPIGSTPNALALSEDEEELFIANADNNCLAVFEVEEPGKSHSKGFIPTGWYPTSVKILEGKIYVVNGKGMSSLPNPDGPRPVSLNESSGNHEQNTRRGGRPLQYIGGLFKGTMSVIDVPNEKQLATYSESVYANTPYGKEKKPSRKDLKGNPVPLKLGQSSPIKYVFYVIKENRTYDQVLGDVKQGNGDTSLVLFGEKVTPNQHAIVNEFVLLDNFYVDAEVSADGHNWTTAAYANDYVEKTWVTSYGGRGGTYDYEGTREIAHPKDGFIWDHCKRAGVTYRSYGEFVSKGQPTIKSLEGNICTSFPEYNLDIKDNYRVDMWIKDFDSLLRQKAVPQFQTIRLGNDHTFGARKGKPTPVAMVAENDLAVGRLVEYISNSSIWKESAIFIIEDDAQNGSDHVDAHRSTAYIVSPFTKRKAVVSEMYSTSSMLRTMELILNIPPMSQYDAAATPMWACFQRTADLTPFRARPALVDLEAKNEVVVDLQKEIDHLDWVNADALPDLLFNRVVWKAVKGNESEMPAPRRGGFVMVEKEDE